MKTNQPLLDEIKLRADRLICRKGVVCPPMNYNLSGCTPDEISELKAESYRVFETGPLVLEGLDPQLSRDGQWGDGHLVIIWKENWVFCTGSWVDEDSDLYEVIDREPNEWVISPRDAFELVVLLRSLTPEIKSPSKVC